MAGAVAGINIVLLGHKAFVRHMSKAERKLRGEIRKNLRKAGNLVKKEARSRVVVRTGKLKKSITAKTRVQSSREFGVVIGPTQFTGLFVEFGTKRARANPFLRPAVDATAEQVFRLLGQSLRVI